MQQDTTDLQRHQLVDALHQCGHQLRNTAAMLDSYAAVLQNVPHASLPMQNMFQMFTPPLSGAVGPVGGGYAAPPTNGLPVPPAATPTRGRKRRDAAELEQDGMGKKRRKRGEKKEKDPNAPKRPPSAYLIFQNEVREEMKKQFPGIPYIGVLNKISDRWAKMSDEQKKAYTDTTNEMRAKFEVDKAAYESSHGAAGQNGTAPAPAATSPSAPVLAAPAAASVPSAPAPVPAPVQATKPTTDQSPEDESDENDEEDGASEASAALPKESSSSTTSISSSSELGETSTDEEDESSKRPPPSKKKTGTEIEKSASKAKKQTPAKTTKEKAEKENKKKEKKSKKD